jgi:hypothetical protein
VLPFVEVVLNERADRAQNTGAVDQDIDWSSDIADQVANLDAVRDVHDVNRTFGARRATRIGNAF